MLLYTQMLYGMSIHLYLHVYLYVYLYVHIQMLLYTHLPSRNSKHACTFYIHIYFDTYVRLYSRTYRSAFILLCFYSRTYRYAYFPNSESTRA